MRSKRQLGVVGIVVLILAALLGQNWWEPDMRGSSDSTGPAQHRQLEKQEVPAARNGFGKSVGFTSQRSLEEHFEKHGAEFKALTPAEYLGHAQALRDAALSASVLELVRADGVATRFDRKSGTFVAFESDGRIRTCFRPENGEDYFRRQAKR